MERESILLVYLFFLFSAMAEIINKLLDQNASDKIPKTEKEKEADLKTKELVVKQKELIHKLALNKAPTVQKFLKAFFQVNTDYRKYGGLSGSKNPIDRLNKWKKDYDSIWLHCVTKDSDTWIIYWWPFTDPDLYATRIQYDEYEPGMWSFNAIKLIYNKIDRKGSEHFSSGLIIELSECGGIQVYENETHSINFVGHDIDSDVSKMKLIQLDDEHTNQIIDEFMNSYNNRKKLHDSNYVQIDRTVSEYKKQKQDEKIKNIMNTRKL